MMTDDDAGGGGKNGDFWMTSFVNDPLVLVPLIDAEKRLFAAGMKVTRAMKAIRTSAETTHTLSNQIVSLTNSPKE